MERPASTRSRMTADGIEAGSVFLYRVSFEKKRCWEAQVVAGRIGRFVSGGAVSPLVKVSSRHE